VRRVPPLFPPKTWNVHKASVAGAARTNRLTLANHGIPLLSWTCPPMCVLTSIGVIRKDQTYVGLLSTNMLTGNLPVNGFGANENDCKII